jgi:hypothetical protein
VVGELASCGGGEVLAVVACAERRGALAGSGVVLADAWAFARDPELAAGFEHVVLVDPPQFEWVEHAASLPSPEGGYLHVAWGEAERRFALSMLDEQLPRRSTLISVYRDLREAGEASGEELRAALTGAGPQPRTAEVAARCFRVLAELGLVRGEPAAGEGVVGVVSSEETELERSDAFRAYSARHEEARQYLEARRHP